MTTIHKALEPLPCPFCGHVGLDYKEGSTFRWIVAKCGGCSATRGETRIQTFGEGTRDEWMQDAKEDAIREWNKRAALTEGRKAMAEQGEPASNVPMTEDELARLNERGAKAWAGVNAQYLRDGSEPAPSTAGEVDYDYQATFNAIADAAKMGANGLEISVKTFWQSYRANARAAILQSTALPVGELTHLKGVDAGPLSEWVDLVKRGYVSKDELLIMEKDAARVAAARPQPAPSSLITAAQAVVDRWDSPKWKDLPHTGEFIDKLREAIAGAQPVREPLTDAQWDELAALTGCESFTKIGKAAISRLLGITKKGQQS